ncbi:hypothetical protein [Myroides marinus]|uniref:hypothetical protein n=1 Tax=Myroides TaxID=76831 RepID=UPI00257892A3|nr:hypothetical protein [Myroides marinus]MDM1378167.1 hypothetical protein [Myroides marinus]MDM1385447.1 hypothetical protein [Myroides marinus]MDM1392660.1 hypothetical protein [Myroides marinus]
MNEFGSKILTGAIGAVIALYLKYYYDKNEECKRLNYISKTLIVILKNNILPQLELYIDACDSIQKDLQTNIYKMINKGSDFNGLDIDFISYLGKDDVMKIFVKQKLDISKLVDLQLSLKRIVVNPPNAVTNNLFLTIDKISQRHKEFIETTENKEYIKNAEKTMKIDNGRALDTAIDNLELYKKFANKQIDTITELISLLP